MLERIGLGVSTWDFPVNRLKLKPIINCLGEVGVLPIRIAGSMAGSSGVSDALAGEWDEMCSQRVLYAVDERLESGDLLSARGALPRLSQQRLSLCVILHKNYDG